MSSVVVACQTLSDEVKKALAETGVDHPVIWIESGLHNYPETLQKKLQEQIHNISNVENIILVYGYCGNSLLGLSSREARLIIPRVDDCISLLLGSYQRRRLLMQGAGTYFLTRGWLVNESNIIKEYETCVSRYGKEKSQRIFKIVLEHYKRLVLIDTGAYPLDDCVEKSSSFATQLGLEYRIVPGSLELLKKLLTGPWDDDFIVLPPGKELSLDDFRLDVASSLSNLTLFGFGR